MPNHLHPGVYVEEVPSGARPIEGVGTSTGLFIGFTGKGPVGAPTYITSWDDYVRKFGGIRDTGNQDFGDAMGHSINAFFANGGATTYVVRMVLTDSDSAAAGFLLDPFVQNSTKYVTVQASSSGRWGNAVKAYLAPLDPNNTKLGYVFSVVTVAVDRMGNARETLREKIQGLQPQSNDPNYFVDKINNLSEWVQVAYVDKTDSSVTSVQQGTLASGDLSTLDSTALQALKGKQMTLTFDGAGGTATVTFANANTTLDGIVAEIITQVQKTQGQKAFSCVVATTDDGSGVYLLMTSATASATSAVKASGDAATTLKLDVSNAALGATATAGAQVLAAMLETKPGNGIQLTKGFDGLPASPTTSAGDFDTLFGKLLKYPDVNIICLPGLSYDGTGNAIIDKAIAHAEKSQSRMVIVDPPRKTYNNATDVTGAGFPTSTYTALYYPWIEVANPFASPESPRKPATVLVPPSGFAAGTWAYTDARRGVWKAPAGVEKALLGVSALDTLVEDDEQDYLNPWGVNAIRRMPGYGNVIWGTRTLSTNSQPEWRYVPVRRTAIFLERSIYNGIQWAVFEPNDQRLWSALRLNIEAFLNGLFRAGAFQGEKASDAYFVRCGLGDTMTQGDIDQGTVIVNVGFAPLKPAEFVIIRIQQQVGQS